MDPFFRKEAEEADDPLARALAREREFICESMRVPLSPHVPLAEGACPPRVMIDGVGHALGRCAPGRVSLKTPLVPKLRPCGCLTQRTGI